MTIVTNKSDLCHVFRTERNYFFGAKNTVPKVAINTMVMELIGIRIAATIGDNCPVTANVNPMVLYKRENTRQILNIALENKATFNKLESLESASAAIIASEEGVN